MRRTRKLFMVSLACAGIVMALLLTAVLTTHLLANRDMVKSFIVAKTAQATGGTLIYDRLDISFLPMPHLKETLDACRNHRLLMGIISNAQFYTPYLFEWFLNNPIPDLGFHSDLVLLSYEFGCAKPSPLLFNKAAKSLKAMSIPRKAVLFVGNDMLNDMYPAKQTGFKTALFAGDKRSLRLREDDPRCENLSPDLVLTDLTQLFEFIL